MLMEAAAVKSNKMANSAECDYNKPTFQPLCERSGLTNNRTEETRAISAKPQLVNNTIGNLNTKYRTDCTKLSIGIQPK